MINTKLYIAVISCTPSFYISGFDMKKQNISSVRMSFSKEELQQWVKDQKARCRVLSSRVALLHVDKINSISFDGNILDVSVYRRGSLMTDYEPQREWTRLQVPDDAKENMAYLAEWVRRWNKPSKKPKVV